MEYWKDDKQHGIGVYTTGFNLVLIIVMRN